MSKRQHQLDLHPIAHSGQRIEEALHKYFDQAVAARASSLEIITGKGTGQLKKRVLKFLARPEVRSKYHRIEKDQHNHGRLFVHFRW